MYHIKDGVVITGLKRVMQPAINACVDVYNDFGYELVITSGIDGQGIHMDGSKHFIGEAIDTRTHIFANEKEKVKIYQELKARLGCGYLILLEKTHFHIQTVSVR